MYKATYLVENEEDQTLIIVDTEVSEVDKDDTLVFYTMPLGIILTNHYVFTISFRENKIIDDVVSGSSGHSLYCA